MEERELRKKMITDLINDKNYQPMKAKELAFLLQVTPEDREEFGKILSELVSEGKVDLTKRGKYQALTSLTKLGTFIGNHKGFGFVNVEDEDEDYFIPESKTGGAMHGDKVMIKIINAPIGKRKEAYVVKVVDHANDMIVGYYQKNKKYGFVVPDNRKLSEDIFVPAKLSMGALTGHKVVVKITGYGSADRQPEGEIVEILGHAKDPGTDILSIARSFGIPSEVPSEVLEEIKDVPPYLTKDVIEHELSEMGRLDYRKVLTVTIDGEDAKDLDDAITLKREDDGYELGVHIADVSHYVKENSALDKEALLRGTSVYLLDRVIPMLPKELSNGICSLNAEEDRLALSCIMKIDNDGKVVSYQIAETIINVDRRLSYTEVDEVFEGLSLQHYNEKELKMLRDMRTLSKKLREIRMKRGSVDFDFPEAHIRLDENGEPVEVGVIERTDAHMLIEDFMLLANETIAEDYFWQELPFEYRVHDEPDADKLEKLAEVMKGFGYYFKADKDKIHPKEIQKLLSKIEGTEEEGFISRMTLRSMQQARYSAVCSGHFGLATKYYCHFTSPIRRYPDLQIHRIIKENLHGKLDQNRIAHYEGIIPLVAEKNSKSERRATEAEREVEKLKKVQYMSHRIGDNFTGIISGVTGYGFYVELKNTIEGMVRMTSIPGDFFIYNEEKMIIEGKESGKVYKMGDRVRVTCVAADKLMKTIDFELLKED